MTDPKKTGQVILSVLLIVAALVIIPAIIKLLRGVASVGGLAGDILSAPGDIVKRLNKEMDESIIKEIERECYLLSRTTQYNPANEDHLNLMKVLSSGEIPNSKDIIFTWKKPISQKLGAYVGLQGSVEAVKRKLLKLF